MDDSAVQRDALPGAVAESLLEHLPEPVTVLDHDGVVVFSGGRAGELTGPGELRDRPLFELVHPDHVLAAVDAFADTRASTLHRTSIRVPLRAADGSYQDYEITLQNLGRRDERPGGGLVAAFLHNVTNRVMAEEALRAAQHRALHDPLTGLPNRVLLLDRLGQACARLRRSGGRLVVMFVDLDRLKGVNDTLGHAVGDSLIVAVARRLLQAVRPDDTVARLGGDEFVVVCPDVVDRETRRDLPRRLLEALCRPVVLEPATVCVTASIGIVDAGEEADPTDLIRAADAAMYRAKRAGGNRVSS
jgi:diguanylate cyclase (GGDEF)-like protein/PAS domain S-box-containing protein